MKLLKNRKIIGLCYWRQFKAYMQIHKYICILYKMYSLQSQMLYLIKPCGIPVEKYCTINEITERNLVNWYPYTRIVTLDSWVFPSISLQPPTHCVSLHQHHHPHSCVFPLYFPVVSHPLCSPTAASLSPLLRSTLYFPVPSHPLCSPTAASSSPLLRIPLYFSVAPHSLFPYSSIIISTPAYSPLFPIVFTERFRAITINK
jgi:hypothetical protein